MQHGGSFFVGGSEHGGAEGSKEGEYTGEVESLEEQEIHGGRLDGKVPEFRCIQSRIKELRLLAMARFDGIFAK
jgi:hypothetical protein